MTPCPAPEIDAEWLTRVFAEVQDRFMRRWFYRLSQQNERDRREINRWHDKADLVASLRLPQETDRPV